MADDLTYTVIARTLDATGAHQQVKWSDMSEIDAQNFLVDGAEAAVHETHVGFFGREPSVIGVGVFPYVPELDDDDAQEESVSANGN